MSSEYNSKGMNMEQLNWLNNKKSYDSYLKKDISSTFIHNMKLPVHRWFRYSAGFNAGWVKQEIQSYLLQHQKKEINIFDPFVGSGTVLIEADTMGCNSIGVESHPFISRVARTKLLWKTNIENFKIFCLESFREIKKNSR